jgi:hypothetical protein
MGSCSTPAPPEDEWAWRSQYRGLYNRPHHVETGKQLRRVRGKVRLMPGARPEVPKTKEDFQMVLLRGMGLENSWSPHPTTGAVELDEATFQYLKDTGNLRRYLDVMNKAADMAN